MWFEGVASDDNLSDGLSRLGLSDPWTLAPVPTWALLEFSPPAWSIWWAFPLSSLVNGLRRRPAHGSRVRTLPGIHMYMFVCFKSYHIFTALPFGGMVSSLGHQAVRGFPFCCCKAPLGTPMPVSFVGLHLQIQIHKNTKIKKK